MWGRKNWGMCENGATGCNPGMRGIQVRAENCEQEHRTILVELKTEAPFPISFTSISPAEASSGAQGNCEIQAWQLLLAQKSQRHRIPSLTKLPKEKAP